MTERSDTLHLCRVYVELYYERRADDSVLYYSDSHLCTAVAVESASTCVSVVSVSRANMCSFKLFFKCWVYVTKKCSFGGVVTYFIYLISFNCLFLYVQKLTLTVVSFCIFVSVSLNLPKAAVSSRVFQSKLIHSLTFSLFDIFV